MRKYRTIILILTALASVSCAKNSLSFDQSEEPIDFSWYTRRSVSTKAATVENGGIVEGTVLPEGSSFGVFGYFHAQGENNTKGSWTDEKNNYPNLFYNQQVTVGLNNGSYTYDYEDSRYWPKNEYDRISFIAYYPHSNSLVVDDEDETDSALSPILDYGYDRKGMVAFHYTAPAEAKDHVDFMISDLCVDQSKYLWNNNQNTGLTGGSSGKVKFFFHHALSQIRIKPLAFEVSNPNVTVTLKSVRFKDVYVSGRCVPKLPDSIDTDNVQTPVSVTPTWPLSNLSLLRKGEEDATGVATEACYTFENNSYVLDHPENILMMIPQEFTENGSAAIEVTIDVVRTDGQGTGESYSYSGNVLSVPLYSGVTKWEAGKIYTYSLSLNLKTIRVTAVEVEDWKTATEDVFLTQTN